MSDRVARRRAQTRERIFIEAMRLFAERGFDRVTVADITEAADVARAPSSPTSPPSGTSSATWASRSARSWPTPPLRRAPLRNGSTESCEPLGNGSRPTPNRPGRWPRPAFTLSDLGSANQQRLQRALAEILTEGQKRGELREVPIADAVMALQCNYFACVLLWAADPGGRPLTDRLRASLDIVLNGLTRT